MDQKKLNKDIDNSSMGRILRHIHQSKNIKLAHYTKLQSLFDGIIVRNPEKDKEICLRATNCRYMNDPEELKTGLKIFGDVFGEDIAQTLSDYSTEKQEMLKDKIFLTSFSKQIDYLPMWSMYGANGDGIILVFDSKIIRQLITNGELVDCIYGDKKSAKRLKKELSYPELTKDDITNIPAAVEKFEEMLVKLLSQVVGTALSFLYLFVAGKHKAYNYESEVRLFLQPTEGQEVKYKHADNLIVPFIEVFLPKKSLKEIWIGPCQNMDRADKSIRDYLTTNNFQHVKIHQSEVPYRK